MNHHSRLHNALCSARARLLEARDARGVWTGELSSSALSTATAICALALVERHAHGKPESLQHSIARGLEWLASHANSDGGWGDTVRSFSNISTTALGWAAFGVVPNADAQYRFIVDRAEHWLKQKAGRLEPDPLSDTIIGRYGEDRTFSVPILTMCALAGRLGASPEAWSRVIPLPFELAVCPPEWFAALRLPVVSYALPALIAIGIAHHRHRPSRNPLTRSLRNLTEHRAMDVLTRIQPGNGGFLEATPLTSFVTMSLAASGYADHAVTRKGVHFLVASQRTDGSWPIDTNLATWLTTLAVNALGERALETLPEAQTKLIRDWLIQQQFRQRHPYTNAAPGGWAWTDLPGGVPDADDTAGALLALRSLGSLDDEVRHAGRAGVDWLLGLQNRNGGIPTFCRGWGKLPFDRSSADLTAHAIRAWSSWLPDLAGQNQVRVRKALARAYRFVGNEQHEGGPSVGGWKPLWFGNQYEPDELNWTYGTSRVLLSLSGEVRQDGLENQIAAAANWLARTQRPDGGWGGGHQDRKASIEETALATEALACFLSARWQVDKTEHLHPAQVAVRKGVVWLLERVEAGAELEPAPIGFYFAKLWYFERLYPLIFTVAALGRAAQAWSKMGEDS